MLGWPHQHEEPSLRRRGTQLLLWFSDLLLPTEPQEPLTPHPRDPYLLQGPRAGSSPSDPLLSPALSTVWAGTGVPI